MSKYSFSKGVLRCTVSAGLRWIFLVPSGVVHMVFHYFHSTPAWGHLGMLKTIQKKKNKTSYMEGNGCRYS
jgi:hypothetical protein